jgi:hypothetical protein
MNPLSEPRTFHAPGTLSVWFKAIFWPPSPVPPPAKTVSERQALLAEIAREQTRRETEQPDYERRRESARERLAELRALLREAEAFAVECDTEALSASLNSDVRIRRLEARLRAGASEHIEVFCRDVRDQIEVLRGRDVVGVAERWSRPNPVTGVREHRFISNIDSVERRRVALTAALRAAEALQLEPLDDEAIIARLTTLRDRIPEIEPFMVEASDPLTPGERREVQWRLAEEAAR